MPVKIELSALAQGHWHEYAIRFILGGAITVFAGVVAAEWGPAVAGLFLAFPAIFPASATLVEKHEREKKEKIGLEGARRGREAAALEAAGSALGSLGLVAFGIAVWQIAPTASGIALIVAAVAWFACSIVMWNVRRQLCSVHHPGRKPRGTSTRQAG
jgi:hypothetical protein